MDISEFGLQAEITPTSQSIIGPRFYMTYTDQVWCILFVPGTKDCIVGYSKDIVRKPELNGANHETYWKLAVEMVAEETAMAWADGVHLWFNPIWSNHS